jgi:DNA gyrase/topoisomerase IV subunit B
MVDFEKAEEDYTAKDIELLRNLRAFGKRPGMYIGSTNLTGLHHLVWEIVDNAVDEAVNGYGDKITVTFLKDGSIQVEDEGRGVPVDMHPQTHMPAIQLIYTTLHSGGKFNSKVYQTSAGLHGVGATVTNALSEWLKSPFTAKAKSIRSNSITAGRLSQPLDRDWAIPKSTARPFVSNRIRRFSRTPSSPGTRFITVWKRRAIFSPASISF